MTAIAYKISGRIEWETANRTSRSMNPEPSAAPSSSSSPPSWTIP